MPFKRRPTLSDLSVKTTLKNGISSFKRNPGND